MKKVFILGDGQGWVVDRIVDQMVELMSNRYDFVRRAYTNISSEELVTIANNADLTYYANWDFGRHLAVKDKFTKPFVMGVRSHRYADYVPSLEHIFHFHVINPMLLNDFPTATYIPDGVFKEFMPTKPFVVGMAFQEQSREYKGYFLVKQACDELGIELKEAVGLPSESMLAFYDSVDVMVCASVAEGCNTISMECALMNKPFITTDVGIPHLLNVHKCWRVVDSIKKELLKFYTYPQVKEYTWENVCDKFADLFERLTQ